MLVVVVVVLIGLFGLYRLAIHRATRTGRIAVAAAVLLAGSTLVTGVSSDLGRQVVVATAALSLAWLLGIAVGKQLASAREAERTRVRLAISRDVHDVVGHALGVIVAEAGVARSLPSADAAELRDTLIEVEGHARAALTDVQGLVRSWRDPSPPDLSTLFATTRAAGVRLDIDVDDAVPIGIVIFRVVQESLSNVVRHAPGARCTVTIRRDERAALVTVRDDGSAAPRPGTGGLGLVGLRERVRAAGGTITWGHHSGGGFEVAARLPVIR
ncbi:sensor histidine kinase [Actinoplanes sp. HUAS TT8]|uniref:sensor histidine kinase n=1 Tax=Actinoplanes sp. HUAS TT8 TaxID=3447453 RepID=UPI003F51E404